MGRQQPYRPGQFIRDYSSPYGCDLAQGVARAAMSNDPFCKTVLGSEQPTTKIDYMNQIQGGSTTKFAYTAPATGGCSSWLTFNFERAG